jgi:hypothetical protein
LKITPWKPISLLSAALIMAVALPVLADEWADGNKDWGSTNKVHALKVRVPVANSVVHATNNYLYHNLVGVMDWNAWYVAEIGYLTDNAGWWIGSRRNFYYRYKLPGVDHLTTLWDPGAPGTLHTFYLMWDNSLKKYKFTIDETPWFSPETNVVGFTDAFAGVHAAPNSLETQSPSTRFDSFDWASISQWYWHGNWPAPTFIDTPSRGLGASNEPHLGYTDAWDN